MSKTDVALGPIPSSDSQFMRRVRVHQAWYRSAVLGFPAYGRLAGSGDPCGSVLPEHAVRQHQNFVSGQALARYLDRRQRGWGVDPVRCTSYMTSSQALTFNMLSDVVSRSATCVKLFSRLMDRHDLTYLESADFEFAAQGSGYGLGDKTLIDLLLRFRTKQGGLQVVAVETKLADRFSTRRTGAETGAAYAKVADTSGMWKNLAASVDSNRTRQITRCHALAQSVQLSDGASEGRTAMFVVITHPAETSGHRCVDEYAEHVVDGVLIDRTWDQFLEIACSADAIEPAVASELSRRYVDLSWSRPAWAEFEQPGSMNLERSA